MISKVTFSLLTICLVLGPIAQAQDSGVPDTVAIVLNMNNDTTEAVLELWVYSDELLTSASLGITWDNPSFQMYSVVATALTATSFDFTLRYYENDSLSATNANQRFLFAGSKQDSAGVVGDAAGRRLWASYYFTVSNWNGANNDGVTFDTLRFNPGSNYLFQPSGFIPIPFPPHWEGALLVGSVLPDSYGIVDTLTLEFTVDTLAGTVLAELYAFNDMDLREATVGFSWGQSSAGLTLNNAIPSFLVDTSFLSCCYTYEDNDIGLTNTNQRFIFDSGSPDTTVLGGDAVGRRQWAWYYFTLDWQPGDSIVFDTLSFNDRSAWGFSLDMPRAWVLPHWPGRYVFKASTDVNEIPGDLPQTYTLGQNYPNPFNPTTEIVFELPRRSWVTLTVFNVLGQVVETLVDQELSANQYVATWDGSGVSSGVYFYRLESDDFNETRKMILVK